MTRAKLNFHQQRLRLLFLAVGISCLLWFSIEDQSLVWINLLSLLISGLLTISIFIKNNRRFHPSWNLTLIYGLLFGIMVPVISFLLMVIKTGLHDHPIPDFSPGEIKTILLLTPIWIMTGVLIATGALLLQRGR